MSFFFTLLYITTAYLTPSLLFGPLAPYHIEIFIAVMAVLTSIPGFGSSGVIRLPQTYAILGLACAVVASFVGNLYFGGAGPGLYDFLTLAAAFFLAAINCRKPIHLKLIVLAMVLGSTFYIIRGGIDMYNHVPVSNYVYDPTTLARLRGLGVVNDPNDFSQVMVSLIPMVFLWRSKSFLANIFLVGLPIAVLITGMFLTHSRGGAIALMVVCAVAGRKKIGLVPSVILAFLLLVTSLSLGWSGGRDVSMEAGADRLDAWSVGIQFIKSKPLWGVGMHRFSDFNDITAHNTIIVCAAEIGLPGFVCWVLFMLSTFRQGVLPAGEGTPQQVLAAAPPTPAGRIPSAAELWKAKRSAAVSAPAETAPLTIAVPAGATLVTPDSLGLDPTVVADPQEVRRIARLVVLGLIGFLTAGWFLSRALSMWLFLYSGMLWAIVRMAIADGLPIRKDSPGFLLRWSLIIAAGLLIAVYILLRVRSLMGQH